ncbi:Protein of unknown function, partial [Gryllus bimaculatus]
MKKITIAVDCRSIIFYSNHSPKELQINTEECDSKNEMNNGYQDYIPFIRSKGPVTSKEKQVDLILANKNDKGIQCDTQTASQGHSWSTKEQETQVDEGKRIQKTKGNQCSLIDVNTEDQVWCTEEKGTQAVTGSKNKKTKANQCSLIQVDSKGSNQHSVKQSKRDKEVQVKLQNTQIQKKNKHTQADDFWEQSNSEHIPDFIKKKMDDNIRKCTRVLQMVEQLTGRSVNFFEANMVSKENKKNLN